MSYILHLRSCIVPVPKNNKVGSMNDLRPVALTSVSFKTCEQIVLPQLRSYWCSG